MPGLRQRHPQDPGTAEHRAQRRDEPAQRSAADLQHPSAGQGPRIAQQAGVDASTPPAIALSRLRRSPTAWALTVFFAMQSTQAYIAFGWFARFLDDQATRRPRPPADEGAEPSVG